MDFCDLNFGCPIDVVCRCAGATGSQGYISSNLSCVSTPRLGRQHRLARSPAQHCKPSDQHTHPCILPRCPGVQQGCGVGVPAQAAAHGADCAHNVHTAVLPAHIQDAQGAPLRRLLHAVRSSVGHFGPSRAGALSTCLLLLTKVCALRSAPCRATTTGRTLRTRWCQRPLAGARPPSRSTAARASSATPSEAACGGDGPGTAGLE